MGLPRFILSPQALKNHPAVLSGDDAHHCRILRLKSGDEVLVADGEGHEYSARIVQIQKSTVELELGKLSAAQPESSLRVTLFQGFAKGGKLDWVIQKATELGVSRIVPVVSEFSQMKAVEGRKHRLDRWQEIIRQAVRQSGRTVLPQLETPCSFLESLENVSDKQISLLFQVAESDQPGWHQQLADLPKPAAVSLWVGPEGGFSEAEVVAAREKAIRIVRLGPRVLRSETAGVIAVGLAQFFWGDLS